jgi:hypothetical protein
MRRTVAFCAFAVIATQAFAAEIKGTSTIDAVTVYPSGAEITRVGKVAIERGEHTLLFTDLPADAVASSIRVEGKATGKLDIGSVDTRIVQVARSDEQAAASERRRIEQAIEKLRDERGLLQATIQAAETQKRLIDNLAQMPAQPQPAGTSAVQPNWNELFALIGQRGAEAQKTILETQIKARETDRQIRDLEGKLASLAPTRRARTEVKVSVGAASPLEAEIVRCAERAGLPITMRGCRPAPRPRRRNCNSCAVRPSSSAPARAGTMLRWRCPRHVLQPAPRRRC